MGVIVQIIGSVLILIGFGLAQLGWLDVKSPVYLVVNIIGSGILAVDALLGQQWGFLLLEGVWAIVSVIGLVGVLLQARRTPQASPDEGSD